MKNYIAIAVLIACMQVINAQVGIGTASPDESSILHLESSDKGLLIPKMTSSQRDAIINPANGLMIYNTDLNEFQFNSNTQATPIWVAFTTTPLSSSIGQSVKYSNIDVITNINANSVTNLPVFGLLNWNDNTTLYNANMANQELTVAETGRYKIIVNTSLNTPTNTARLAPEMWIEVNGTQRGTFASTGYIRSNNGHQDSSLHINEVLELNAGDIISVIIHRAANGGTVNLRSAGSTDIYIEKIL